MNIGPAATLGVRLFFLPFIAIGAGSMVALVGLFVWALLGANLSGTVTGVSTRWNKGWHYLVDYSFPAAGTIHSDSDDVTYDIYQRFQHPDSLTAGERRMAVRRRRSPSWRRKTSRTSR